MNNSFTSCLPTRAPRAHRPLRGFRSASGALCMALAFACVLPGGAWAQQSAISRKDASNATTHSRVSDGDRVFLRSAASRFSHDQRLADLARTRASSRDVKAFAAEWKATTDRLKGELDTLTTQNKVAVPKDMSDQAEGRVRDLDGHSGADFDAAFMQQARESLTQENKLFQDSVRKMENEQVRDWADGALKEIRAQSARAEDLAAKAK
jgi:predicted outer membrane protein